MKSIANQYKDLREGRMSQANFMRNLRMSMPQYITNVTSFKDAVKILKNKAILTETLNENSRAFDVAKALKDKYNMGEEEIYVYLIDDMGLDNIAAQSVVDQLFGGENGSNDDELAAMVAKAEEEEAGKYTKFDDFEGGLSEGRKKKEAKKELHPNQIHPQELRMGIKVELEHTDDLDKAKKIALDHLAENPFYYTALKLAGVESPSAPKAKAPVEKKAKKRKEAVELVDKANAMQKVKMPKDDTKKKLKEARLNIDGEPNAVVKQAMGYVDGPNANPTLKALSDKIEFQQTMDPNEALLRYDYWEELPEEAVEKLKLQFNVELDRDSDEDTGDIVVYRLTPKNKSGNLGSSLEQGASKASQMDTFKESLEAIVREVVAEYYDGRDNLDENIDEDKLKKYYKYLLSLGGGDLGGEYEDMLNKAKNFNSTEEFIEDDINILATDDEEQAYRIKKWVEQNIN